MMSWHWLDYIILAVIGLSVITGLFRGFVKELVALIVWALAIWLAYNYSKTLDPYLLPYIKDQNIRMAVSFIAVLLATLIAGGLFNALLSFILTRSGLSGTDRLLGMGFGFVRGVFIVAFVMLVVKITAIPHTEYSEQSRLYAKFDPLVNWLSDYMPAFVTDKETQENMITMVQSDLPGDKLLLNNDASFNQPDEP